MDRDPEIQEDSLGGLNFLYPFGTSMLIEEPVLPLLSSGPVSYPVNEVLMCMSQIQSSGKLFVLGSWRIFSDGYYEKEENEKVFEFIMNNIGETVTESFEPVIEEEINEKFKIRKITPNIEVISEKLKNALQESSDISNTFFNKFDYQLFKAQFDLLPEALQLYDKL